MAAAAQQAAAQARAVPLEELEADVAPHREAGQEEGRAGRERGFEVARDVVREERHCVERRREVGRPPAPAQVRGEDGGDRAQLAGGGPLGGAQHRVLREFFQAAAHGLARVVQQPGFEGVARQGLGLAGFVYMPFATGAAVPTDARDEIFAVEAMTVDDAWAQVDASADGLGHTRQRTEGSALDPVSPSPLVGRHGSILSDDH